MEQMLLVFNTAMILYLCVLVAVSLVLEAKRDREELKELDEPKPAKRTEPKAAKPVKKERMAGGAAEVSDEPITGNEFLEMLEKRYSVKFAAGDYPQKLTQKFATGAMSNVAKKMGKKVSWQKVESNAYVTRAKAAHLIALFDSIIEGRT